LKSTEIDAEPPISVARQDSHLVWTPTAQCFLFLSAERPGDSLLPVVLEEQFKADVLLPLPKDQLARGDGGLRVLGQEVEESLFVGCVRASGEVETLGLQHGEAHNAGAVSIEAREEVGIDAAALPPLQ
jgi:hypothetical protein